MTTRLDGRGGGRARRVTRMLVALGFVAIGTAHFVDPTPFVTIVPPSLPAPLALVWISGFFEAAGGIGLLVRRLRRAAGVGLLALLAAVYPANVYMLVREVYLPGMPHEPWLLWARMPLQFVFAALVVYAAGPWRDAGAPRR